MRDETKNTDEDTNTTTEIETLRRENEELRSAARLREVRERMINDLSGAGARSPELLFGSVRSELQFDENGTAVNAADLISDLKKRFPEQFASETPVGGIDAGAGTRQNVPPLSQDALAKMSPDEIRRLDWAEVREVLSRQNTGRAI